jgi:hypothetical protein
VIARTARQYPLVASLVVVLALAPIAFAAKGAGSGKPSGGGGGGSSLQLVLANDVNGNGLPNWGDTVTWNVSTTATSSSQVSLSCSQNGANVYYAQAAFYAGNPFAWTQMMPLQSGAWTSGAASCTATLFYSSGRRTVTLATLNFAVGA